MAAEKKNTTLTARETELAILGYRALKSPPEVDYAKMIELGGFKNVASARACFGPIMKKLMEGDAAPAAGPTPKKAAKRPVPQDKDNGGSDGTPTPSKKARNQPRKKTAPGPAVKPELLTAGDDEEDKEEEENDDGF